MAGTWTCIWLWLYLQWCGGFNLPATFRGWQYPVLPLWVQIQMGILSLFTKRRMAKVTKNIEASFVQIDWHLGGSSQWPKRKKKKRQEIFFCTWLWWFAKGYGVETLPEWPLGPRGPGGPRQACGHSFVIGAGLRSTALTDFGSVGGESLERFWIWRENKKKKLEII